VARVRALESARPDRLFEDPLAQTFADAFPRPPGSPGPAGGSAPSTRLALQIVVRTRFYDEYLVAATEGGCRQVVLVGAGLDTRAFRLAWPAGTVVYELDLPEVIEAKASVLARAGARPQSDRRVVSVDLRQDWGTALVDAGFDGTSPTAWLIEGVLVYLDAAEAEPPRPRGYWSR
jgi:methyltransferase (TIGR00027 family)